jgi:DnaJ family protein C protein 9
MCSEEAEDGHRFADVVDAAVKEGAAASYETYEAWRAEVRKRKAPKDPLGARKTKKASKSKKGGDDADLFALIRGKQAMRADQADNMFAALEAKYANPKKKTKK